MKRYCTKARSSVTAAALLALFSPSAVASPTATFEVGTFVQMAKGEPKGTLVSSNGEIVPGMGSHAIKTAHKALMYWSRARGKDGTLYLGSGSPGKIFALKNGRVRLVADLKTILVSALAIGPGGKLLAGTLPDARILEVDPQSGKWRELGRLPSKHVWDLLYDKGQVFAAGGAPGKIYTLPAGGGKPSVYFDPGDKHMLCLAKDGKGNLLTGGTAKAILYRVRAKGKAEAVHDFDATELRRIAVGPDGMIYVTVNKFRRRMAGLPRYDRPQKGKGGTKLKVKVKGAKRPKFLATELRPGAKRGKGAVFSISPSGRAVQLHSLKGGYFTDLGIDEKGQVWAAEGTKGKVFLIRGRKVATIFDVKQRQVLVLDVGGKVKHFATGDAGAIYRVDAQPKGGPVYLSQAFDAKYVARWGNLRYWATAKLAIASRSGNTAKPDKTWGPWTASRSQGKRLVRLASKPARYLQLRLTWRGAGALRSLSVFYRAQNQAGRIKELKISRNAKKPTERKIKLKWKVDNPDKDPLVYHLFYREELGAGWRPLGDGKPKKKPTVEWETEGIADGTYRIKIVVSDELANGPTSVQKSEKISPPIIVDNRRPTVIGLKVRFPYVTGIAKDGYSVIKKIEYAVDAADWHVVDSVDGLYDSSSEAFRIGLPSSTKRGAHTLTVRVTDSAKNAGVRQVRFVR